VSAKTQSDKPQTFSRSLVIDRSWPVVLDLTVFAACLAVFYGVLYVLRYWFSPPEQTVVISQSASALPLYAFYSVVRISVAYLLSLVFAVGYGYFAAYHPRVEALMIAILDILQSIPVLSFLPGVMLAMVALIPSHQLGIELGAIVLIFTGAVWNMAFSFYSSLKSIPRELMEASTINNFTAWQRFWQLELPAGAIGLVWNSMMSVAGAWFFLMTCEMFPIGNRDFRLPGLGSYLQTAANHNDTRAMIFGVVVMLAIIVMTDQLIWRPVIAWSNKFKFEQVESTARVRSPILYALQNSKALIFAREHTLDPLGENVSLWMARRYQKQRMQPHLEVVDQRRSAVMTTIFAVVLLIIILVAAVHALALLRYITWGQVGQLLKGAAATFCRVNLSLVIASAWTIPVGVAIGFHPKLARIAQPIAQIAASFPAPILFPIILLALIHVGLGIGTGSILLMLLGTQWYILFNVVAGAMAIPNDLKEVSTLFRFGSVQRWKTVILPGIFPYLLTGLVTASGGAWNASIIAEYFHLHGDTLSTIGLGAQINHATDHGEFPILLLATIIMAMMVVTINRLVWRPLYHLAETKYRLGDP
jgi:NitT/TauT family transport system permease protein